MLLTTLENAKAWLLLPSSPAPDDPQLLRLISAASAFIESWLSRSLGTQSYREWRDGTGRELLVFGNGPVQSVQLVRVNGKDIPPASSPTGYGYRFDRNVLLLQGELFARGRRNIELQYTAGYDTVPADLEQACLECVALRYRERERIGHQSKSLAGETVSFFLGELSPTARAVLQQYRKVVPT